MVMLYRRTYYMYLRIMHARKMHWFPVALSGVAAGFSAISLMGTPGFVMAQDMRYLPTLFTGILSIPITFFILIPET